MKHLADFLGMKNHRWLVVLGLAVWLAALTLALGAWMLAPAGRAARCGAATTTELDSISRSACSPRHGPAPARMAA